MEQSNNTGKVIGALLLGAAAGSILGILFAPDKGSKTRKKILDKGDDLTEAMKDKLDGFLEEVKKEVEVIKEKATAFVGNGAAKTEKIKVD
ncbi:MAG: YtxH domain-containing protein [Chitinophagaceae bacterium]|nr:YtxH domain-containing protein [Chitinophagaceae bacterium]MDP1812724.1 YtxH domain-containing protein [Sediminibacterium sp.]MDP3129620.1 YtxH domain-containing protein [Sediminibacterium sp.]